MPHVPALKRALVCKLGPEYSDKIFLDATFTEYNRGSSSQQLGEQSLRAVSP
jgi:hypothetical protein